ncbi:properdin-like [Salminus brasiliensis]|uniref:properdin-like n=1 Tax=Salminus brasiliensis TaxID=930266 RepID=UPI003B8371D6
MKLIMMCMMLLLVLHVQPAVSQMVQCYSEFSLTNGTCNDVLGEVSLDDCCMNSKYGYVERGVCKSCRYPAWTEWSEWSECTVTCMVGVKQRRRACYGMGKCHDFSQQGSIQTMPCVDRDCCPENGGWSQWSPWQPCSATCETGIKIRNRKCTEPPPKCGGSCFGDSEEITDCDTGIVCPTHGGWSAWGSWGTCMETCQKEGFQPPIQTRHRTCTNPPPSTVPRGNDCQGSSTETQKCHFLPFCPVNGNWGAWLATSECSVTCGVGKQIHHRKCDSPAPKHAGKGCRGDDTKMTLCSTNINCPVDGHWSEWGEWSECKPPSSSKTITCRNRQGSWKRLRSCLGRKYGGLPCPGEMVDLGTCYQIQGCDLQGLWSEWSPWGFCKPDCGQNASQTREKTCIPDVSKYSVKNLKIFSGKPNIKCDLSEDTEQSRPCSNLPQC